MTQKKYSRHFIPLEPTPTVFNHLLSNMDIFNSRQRDFLRFQKILDLEDRDKLRQRLKLTHALILHFPTTDSYKKRVQEEDAQLEEYDQSGEQEDVLFIKQTIKHAGGLYATLHALYNGTARHIIGLRQDFQELKPLTPDLRARKVEQNRKYREAYMSAVKFGRTPFTERLGHVNYHFVCFVKSHKNGYLYLMDGDRKRPIDLGYLQTHEDVLSDTCLDVIQGMMAAEQNNKISSEEALCKEFWNE